MSITDNEPQYFKIWGSMSHGFADAQVVWEQWATKAEADAKCEDLNNTPSNHPDLAYWVESIDIDHMLECGIEGE